MDYEKGKKADILQILAATYGSMLRPLSRRQKTTKPQQTRDQRKCALEAAAQKRERKRLKRLKEV